MKRIGIVLFIILAMLLVACSAPKDTQTLGSEKIENTLPTMTETSETETTTEPNSTENKPKVDFMPSGNEMLDLDTYTLENDPAEYSQASYPWNYISSSDGGYYYNSGMTLRFFDKESQTAHTVCNKPNCMHEDSSCVAHPAATNLAEETDIDIMFQIYYKGYVYCIGQNKKSEYVYLCRIAEDGSTRENYMPLFRYDSYASTFISPHYILFQDTVYYVNWNEEQPCLRKCKLGAEEQTVTFATERAGGSVHRMKGCGDFLFLGRSV